MLFQARRQDSSRHNKQTFHFHFAQKSPWSAAIVVPKLKLKWKPQVGRDGDEVGDDCSLRCCCLVTNAVYFQIWQIIARNARLTHFFLDFEKRNPKYLPSALENKNKRDDKRGQKLILQVTKRQRRVETHIGEIFQLFSVLLLPLLTTKFYWQRGLCFAFFLPPRQTSQLLAKGSASIQLICQSVWLGLLLLGAARVICKIHCSTISVESCVLAVFFTSSWREDSAKRLTDKLNWLFALLLLLLLLLL